MLLVSTYDCAKQSENVTIYLQLIFNMICWNTKLSLWGHSSQIISFHASDKLEHLCLSPSSILKTLEVLQLLLLPAAFGSSCPSLPPHTHRAAMTSKTTHSKSKGSCHCSFSILAFFSAISHPSVAPFHFPGAQWLYPSQQLTTHNCLTHFSFQSTDSSSKGTTVEGSPLM